MSDWFARFGHAQVGDALHMGAYPQDADDVATLRAVGITAVLNLVRDVEYQLPGARTECASALAAAGITEHRVEVIDFGNLLPGQIEVAARTVRGWLDAGECVYVHCRAGMQRSAVITAAVISLLEEIEPAEALCRVRARNPRADPLAHQLRDLERWWTARAG